MNIVTENLKSNQKSLRIPRTIEKVLEKCLNPNDNPVWCRNCNEYAMRNQNKTLKQCNLRNVNSKSEKKEWKSYKRLLSL